MNAYLAIDFGTSYTAAAVAKDGKVDVLHFGGDGSPRLPSCVFLQEDGTLLTGFAAADQAFLDPSRFEQNPKRWVGDGEIPLGVDDLPVADAIGAVLRSVMAEATLQLGLPQLIVLTHPAKWTDHRIAVLREAARSADLDAPLFLPEPVAAAVHFAEGRSLTAGPVAVYDLGGGTFDAAVVARSGDAFAVAGMPGGIDPLGGEEFDRSLMDHISRTSGSLTEEEWDTLRRPTTPAARSRSIELLNRVKRAKEALSTTESFDVAIPASDLVVHVTRAELWDLVRSDIDATITELESTLAEANATSTTLSGLYLAGGSSRMPLVKDMLWRRVGVEPQMLTEPKATIALGAARWASAHPSVAATTGGGRTGEPGADATTTGASGDLGAFITALRGRLSADGFLEVPVAPDLAMGASVLMQRTKMLGDLSGRGGPGTATPDLLLRARGAIQNMTDSFRAPEVVVFVIQPFSNADLGALRAFNDLCCAVCARTPWIQQSSSRGKIACFGVAVLPSVDDKLGASAGMAAVRWFPGGNEYPVVVDAARSTVYVNLRDEYGAAFHQYLLRVFGYTT